MDRNDKSGEINRARTSRGLRAPSEEEALARLRDEALERLGLGG